LRDWAKSASCNAHGHLDCLRQLEGGGSTTDGLRSEIGNLLASSTYPTMVHEALDDGRTDVAGWLDTLVTYKRSHVDDLRALLAGVGGQP
jgi:hypothetical protein